MCLPACPFPLCPGLSSGASDAHSQSAKIPFTYDLSTRKHWFNHLLVNPDGTRLVFLNRWTKPNNDWRTRMVTVNLDGSDVRVVDRSGCMSHFIWRDPGRILSYSGYPRTIGHKQRDCFCLFEDKPGGGNVEIIGTGVMVGDGHCTYLPGQKYILNDTYPDTQRNQNPYLYELATGRRIPLGRIYQPPQYTGEWRCDTHPRCTADSRSVVVDAPFEKEGRQLQMIDISEIVG